MTRLDEDKRLNTPNSSQKPPVLGGKWPAWTRVTGTHGRRGSHTARRGQQSSVGPEGCRVRREARPSQDRPWGGLTCRTRS